MYFSLTIPFEDVLGLDQSLPRGERIIGYQLPFTIGFMFAISDKRIEQIVEHIMDKEWLEKLLNDDPAVSIDDKVEDLIRYSERTERLEIAKQIAALEPLMKTNDPSIIHLGTNGDDDQLLLSIQEPNTKSINELVAKFMDAIVKGARVRQLLKLVIMYDLTAMLIEISQAIKQLDLGFTRYHLFRETEVLINKFAKETFLISFNGAKYDLHLIINSLYEYQLQNSGVSMKTFKKGTIYSSVNIRVLDDHKDVLFITFKDLRNMVEPNINLDLLSQRYDIPTDIAKGIFPHSRNTSVR